MNIRAKTVRGTLELGIKAARTLYYAEMQAERIGLPLNLSITINFTSLGIHPDQAFKVFAKLRNQRFAPWARRPPKRHATWSFTPTYSYGFENARDDISFDDPDGEHNVHVHWAAHVPATRHHDFRNRLHSWISEIAGTTDWPENALMVKLIEKSGGVSVYLVKGAAQPIAEHFGIKPESVKPQGFILGRRTGTTINIGPAARRALDRKLGVNRKR